MLVGGSILVWVDPWQMQCCGDPFAVAKADGWHPEDEDESRHVNGYLVDLQRAEA